MAREADMPKSLDSAFVWSELRDELLGFIRSRVADEHAADDILQETFLAIHRGLGSLESEERVRGWVYRIARNAIVDHYRARPGMPGRLSEPESEAATIAAEREDGGDAVLRHADLWLREILTQLPDRYREPLELAEIEGLSQEEVARRLGLSVSGAKSRIQRGRKLLTAALERCCVFHVDRRGRLVECEPKPHRTVCLDEAACLDETVCREETVRRDERAPPTERSP
jgi:RNA polymerase sigma-70 factor (ECF subfamily)